MHKLVLRSFPFLVHEAKKKNNNNNNYNNNVYQSITCLETKGKLRLFTVLVKPLAVC